MKRCLAILYSSILFSICLGFGFVRADDQPGVEISLQEQTDKLQADKLVDDVSSDDVYDYAYDDVYDDVCGGPCGGPCDDNPSDSISLSDISLDEISLIEKPLTFGDKMDLYWFWLKVQTGEYKDSAVKHFLRNQREYAYGLVAGTIVVALVGIYFLNQKNKKVVAPQN